MSEMTDAQKLEALLRIVEEGSENLNAAEALIMSSRVSAGQYVLGEAEISALLRNFGVVGRCLNLTGDLYRKGAEHKGIAIPQKGEDMKQPQLNKLVAATQEAVVSGFGAKDPAASISNVEQAKQMAAERQRTSLIRAFGKSLTENGSGPLEPGFRGLNAYRNNLLQYDPETLNSLWHQGFYGKDEAGNPTQFFIRGTMMEKEVLFLFVFRAGVAELADPIYGDLYVAGDGLRYNGPNMSWLPVKNFSITPAMQIRGVYARAIHHLIVS